MKAKKDECLLDYVGRNLEGFLHEIAKETSLENAISTSFFITGQVLLDSEGEREFEKWISLIRGGVKSHKKQRNKLNKRKAG